MTFFLPLIHGALLLGIACWYSAVGGTLIHRMSQRVRPPHGLVVSSVGFRGGGDSDASGADSGDQNDTTLVLADANEKEPHGGEEEYSSKQTRGAIQGPFRLLNEIREEVNTVTHIISSSPQHSTDGGDNGNDSSIPDPQIEVVASNANGKIGPPLMIDTKRVAPLSLRLIVTGNETEIEEEKGKPADIQIVSDVAKLWWVNVWTQQLSDSDTSERFIQKGGIPSIDTFPPQENPTFKKETGVKTHTRNDRHIGNKESPIELKRNEIQTDEFSPFQSNGDSSFPPDSEGACTSSAYVSSGLWRPVDNLLTFGLASTRPSLRISKRLRGVRKAAARTTGLHGFLSGKPLISSQAEVAMITLDNNQYVDESKAFTDGDGEDPYRHDQKSLRRPRFSLGFRSKKERGDKEALSKDKKSKEETKRQEQEEKNRREEEVKEEEIRMNRVKEIDQMMAQGQERLQHLVCEKDVLQRRLNPLYNYTTEKVHLFDSDEQTVDEVHTTQTNMEVQASRKFNFPPDDLVEDYLDMIISTRRLVKMNHTYLWQDVTAEDDGDESIGDDLLTPSGDAHKLYRESKQRETTNTDVRAAVGRTRNGGGGSWLLRQTIGKGPSIGEKVGEVAETAAYKAVCAAIMSLLARTLSSLHGINVMKHSDIRLVLEQAPDLPRVGEGVIPGSTLDYAQETLKSVMRRKAKRGKRRAKAHSLDDPFVQKDAVTEMLLSHVQISAPLLKLFPIAWQRAFLGNIITLSTAVMSDFFDGLQFQILGHSLTFTFTPITEDDMIKHFGLSSLGSQHRRVKAEEFEEAVRATAEDVGEELKFLDRWHERALGSGVLRTQIAHLIARIVLTLTDEVLGGARMDLWSANAGGPRMLAGLEYRTKSL